MSVLALLVASCSAQAVAPRPSASPDSTLTPRATSRPANASNDVVWVRSNAGTSATIVAIDARTGKTLRSLNDGAVSAKSDTVYWSESVNGGTKTAVHLTDLATGADLRSFTIDGDLRPVAYPTIFDPLVGDRRISPDGHYLALMNTPYKIDGQWLTNLAIVNTQTGTIESSTELRGQSTYGFVTFAPDGRSVFLEQYGQGETRTHAFDVATEKLLDLSGQGITTTGFRTAAALTPDGRWMFRLDSGSATTNCTSTDGPSCIANGVPPYIVALDLVTRRATQLMLPAEQRSGDFEKYLLWSLAMTSDGSTLYAVNPALGVIDEVDPQRMSLRRTGSITVAQGHVDALATIAQFFFPAAEAKRYTVAGALLSADGRTMYAAAHDGLAVIDTATLSSRSLWQPSHQFDTMRLSSDGRRLYAMDNMSGKLVMIDTTTGGTLGDVDLQYAQAILRIDDGR